MPTLKYIGVCNVCGFEFVHEDELEAMLLAKECEESPVPERQLFPGEQVKVQGTRVMTISNEDSRVIRFRDGHGIELHVEDGRKKGGYWISQEALLSFRKV